MKLKERFSCDLCRKEFEAHADVSNDLSLNAAEARHWNEICENCAVKVIVVLDEAFPKNKPLA